MPDGAQSTDDRSPGPDRPPIPRMRLDELSHREARRGQLGFAPVLRLEGLLDNAADEIRITVTDNGTGIPATPEHVGGLADLAARAVEFDGRFEIAPPEDGPGTVLSWSAAYPRGLAEQGP